MYIKNRDHHFLKYNLIKFFWKKISCKFYDGLDKKHPKSVEVAEVSATNN